MFPRCHLSMGIVTSIQHCSSGGFIGKHIGYQERWIPCESNILSFHCLDFGWLPVTNGCISMKSGPCLSASDGRTLLWYSPGNLWSGVTTTVALSYQVRGVSECKVTLYVFLSLQLLCLHSFTRTFFVVEIELTLNLGNQSFYVHVLQPCQ